MAAALKKCRTVDEFERFLDGCQKPMGVQANFGVIDAGGAGAYFETDDNSFKRYDLADEPSGVILDVYKRQLMFIEGVVNDYGNGFTPEQQVRGMEGVVRHALEANPYTDIVMLHFIHDKFIDMRCV